MRNAGLDASQAGIKTAGRRINNLRFVDGTPPNPLYKLNNEPKIGILHSNGRKQRELNSLLMRVKEESKQS